MRRLKYWFMKKITLTLFALGMAAGAFAAKPNWLTNLPEAADQASRENKLLLLDFTGSDWCGWCKKLDGEIFSKPEFIDYASNNLVLVQVDFPMHKSQADDLKEANRALKKKYDVSGYPTVLVIKPDGSIVWEQRGYEPGGASAMIDAVNRCRKAFGLAPPTHLAPTAAAAAPVAVEPAKPAAPVAAEPIQQPATPPQKPGEEPKLQGILYSASHSSAVLNGKMCEVGDVVHGIKVLKIARDKVTVEYQGQIKVLKTKENQGEIKVSKIN
jgi:thioredoxin-related protein